MRIETVTLTSADGVHLAADVIDHDAVAMGVVVAHPHPLYGGDRHHHVVDSVWRAAGEAGACAVRFDFRGAGQSQGRHAGGALESQDVIAARDDVTRRHGEVPVWLAGYSFGALVAAAVDDAGVEGWLLIAPPLGIAPEAAVPRCAHDPRPKVLVVPQHDEFCPPSCVDAHCATWVNTRQIVLPHATHALVAQRSVLAQIAVDAICASSAGPTPQQPPT